MTSQCLLFEQQRANEQQNIKIDLGLNRFLIPRFLALLLFLVGGGGGGRGGGRGGRGGTHPTPYQSLPDEFMLYMISFIPACVVSPRRTPDHQPPTPPQPGKSLRKLKKIHNAARTRSFTIFIHVDYCVYYSAPFTLLLLFRFSFFIFYLATHTHGEHACTTNIIRDLPFYFYASLFIICSSRIALCQRSYVIYMSQKISFAKAFARLDTNYWVLKEIFLVANLIVNCRRLRVSRK